MNRKGKNIWPSSMAQHWCWVNLTKEEQAKCLLLNIELMVGGKDNDYYSGKYSADKIEPHAVLRVKGFEDARASLAVADTVDKIIRMAADPEKYGVYWDYKI